MPGAIACLLCTHIPAITTFSNVEHHLLVELDVGRGTRDWFVQLGWGSENGPTWPQAFTGRGQDRVDCVHELGGGCALEEWVQEDWLWVREEAGVSAAVMRACRWLRTPTLVPGAGVY